MRTILKNRLIIALLGVFSMRLDGENFDIGQSIALHWRHPVRYKAIALLDKLIMKFGLG